MAKGLEDTAFYRYNRFVALNEVGGHPDQFGVSLAAFHKANAQRAEHWPHAMLGTSTHDTKRGEDTRARLAVLSEMPEEWARQVAGLEPHAARAPRRRRGHRAARPQRRISVLPAAGRRLAGRADRRRDARPGAAREPLPSAWQGAMVKSMREAKLHSTWAAPNTAYEEAMLGFVARCARCRRGPTPFSTRSCRSRRASRGSGVRNSLVQTVLKLTLPGVPDIYQGAELWDLSLVDPGQSPAGRLRNAHRAARGGSGAIGAKPRHRRCSTCWKIGATAASNWRSSRPCWPTAAIIRSCLRRGDMSRSSPPAPEPTRSAPLPDAMKRMRWSLRLRAFRCAARPNRIGAEPRSLGRRRRVARRIGVIFSADAS